MMLMVMFVTVMIKMIIIKVMVMVMIMIMFNFIQFSALCELSTKTRFSHPRHFRFSPGSLYFDHPSRPFGGCGVSSLPCQHKSKCIAIPQVPGYKCKCYHGYTGSLCNGEFLECH